MSAADGEDDRAAAKPADAASDAAAPLGLAGQIIADIVEQAPLYGLSGAIFAAGLVTGRRALARTGARMLVGQLLSAVTSASIDRALPKVAAPAPAEPPARIEPPKIESAPPPAAEPASPEAAPAAARRPGAVAVATGAVASLAAVAAGGWLVRRLLAKKPPAEKA
jgi:hypothetical protein